MDDQPHAQLPGATPAAQERPRFPGQAIARRLLEDIVAGHRRVLGDRGVLGLYLAGSLATGDFDGATSDLDFLAVLASAATDGEAEGLREMHGRIRAANENRLYRNYEGDYLTRERALDPTAPGAKVLRLDSDGGPRVQDLGDDALIELWKVRACGFAVLGPPPEDLVGDIGPGGPAAASARLFRDRWLPKLARREPMDDEYRAYAALTMARVLYTAATGGVASKRRAAAWYAGMFRAYAPAVAEALAWRPGRAFGRQEEVYGLIGFVGRQLDCDGALGVPPPKAAGDGGPPDA